MYITKRVSLLSDNNIKIKLSTVGDGRKKIPSVLLLVPCDVINSGKKLPPSCLQAQLV